MAESLWNVADDYLASRVAAVMGSGGSYTTLKIATVKKWAVFDAIDLDNITLPATIIVSPNSTATPAGHGSSSTIIRKNTYLVTLVNVVEGTKEQATADAKTLAWRTENMLAETRIQGAASDDGSKVDRIIGGDNSVLFRSQVTLWDKPTSEADSVYGIGITAIAMTGTTV